MDDSKKHDDPNQPEDPNQHEAEQSGFKLGAPEDEELKRLSENAHAFDQDADDDAIEAEPAESVEMLGADDVVDDSGSESEIPPIRWKEEPDESDAEEYEPVAFKGDKSDRESEMDMTPMVDVTFLLLIFFMVTASFTLQKTIEQPPQQEEEPSPNVVEEEEEADYILVYVDEYNSFQVIYGDNDWECPSEQELIRRLHDIVNDPGGGAIPTDLRVMAHGDALHERVVLAMDAGTEVKMASIQVVMTEVGP